MNIVFFLAVIIPPVHTDHYKIPRVEEVETGTTPLLTTNVSVG